MTSWDGKQFIIDEIETHDGNKTLRHEVWSDITSTPRLPKPEIRERPAVRSTDSQPSTERGWLLGATKVLQLLRS